MFAGTVWFDVIAHGEGDSRLRVNSARFAPRPCTGWHSHSLGPPSTSPRGAVGTGTGRLTARGTAHDVTFTAVTGRDLELVDAGYRAKDGRYASIVDHLQGPVPRAAALEVLPA